MNGLVAQKRLNKNGVMVTKWVKPSGGDSSASAIPAPAPMVDESLKEAVAQLDNFLSQYQFDVDDPETTELLRRNVARMGSEAPEFVERLWDHSASDSVYNITVVADTIYGDSSVVAPEHRGTVLNNYMQIIPEYNEDAAYGGVDAAHFAALVFRGIDGYSHTAPYTEDEITGYKATAKITEAIFPLPDMENAESTGYVTRNNQIELLDRRSADLLVQNASKADTLVDALVERKTIRAEVIQDFIDTGVLRDGTL